MLYVNPLSTPYAVRTESLVSTAGHRQLALKELEQYFLFTLLQEMRKSIPHSGAAPRSPEQRLYEEMLDDALSGVLAEQNQLGIAQMVEQQLGAAEQLPKLPVSPGPHEGRSSSSLLLPILG
jgi:Rod binding domain-containing protein